jgi:tellurite resistance protein TerC
VSLEKIKYLQYGLAAVLTFAGLKLVTQDWIHVPPLLSVGIIVGILGTTIILSLRLAPEGRSPNGAG